jgi:two-component system sensor histidine kinase/response regulator
VRKAAKRGLQSNDRLFRSVFDYAQIGISVFGIDRREHYSNRAMREMLGYTEEELSHLEKWDEITHPDDRVSCAERYAALLRGKLEKDAYEQRFVGRPAWTVCRQVRSLKAGIV